MAVEGKGYTVKHRDEFEREWDRWLLVRRGLGVSSFGLNIVEVEPGGNLTEHDELERDQEEVFVFLSGDVDARDRRARDPRARRDLCPGRPRGEADGAERRRHGRRGADHLSADDERLRADGLGLRASRNASPSGPGSSGGSSVARRSRSSTDSIAITTSHATAIASTTATAP